MNREVALLPNGGLLEHVEGNFSFLLKLQSILSSSLLFRSLCKTGFDRDVGDLIFTGCKTDITSHSYAHISLQYLVH